MMKISKTPTIPATMFMYVSSPYNIYFYFCCAARPSMVGVPLAGTLAQQNKTSSRPSMVGVPLAGNTFHFRYLPMPQREKPAGQAARQSRETAPPAQTAEEGAGGAS